MGSEGRQFTKPAIAAVTGSSSSCSLGAASFPEDVSAYASCPSAAYEPNLVPPPCYDFPTSGNFEAHLSSSDVNKISVVGSAAVCVSLATSPTSCDYTSLAGSGTVHGMMHVPTLMSSQLSFAMEGATLYTELSKSGDGDTAAHVVSLPSSNHEVIPSGNVWAHGKQRSTSNFFPVTYSSEPSKHVFIQCYVNNLLPALQRIHGQGFFISLNEKRSAVKLAADMSLAISAGGNNRWSQALMQELASTSTSNIRSTAVKSRRSKKWARKSSIFRGSFSARAGSILRSRHRRGGSHAAANVGGALFSPKGSSNVGFGSSARGRSCAHPLGNAALARGVSHMCRMSQQLRLCFLASKRAKRSRSGVSLYMRLLQNSRSGRSCGGVKASTDAHSEVCRSSSPSMSKVHIESLGRLVPGGRSMDAPLLLQEAADYILSLQMQVEALQSLSHVVVSL